MVSKIYRETNTSTLAALSMLLISILSTTPYATATKVVVDENNMSQFEDLVTSKKGGTTACHNGNSVAWSRSATLEVGILFKIFTRTKLKRVLKRWAAKNRRKPSVRLVQRMKVMRKARKRCDNSSDDDDQASANPAPNRHSVGINAAWISDYGTEIVFVDIFKQSRPFVASYTDGSGWDVGTLSLRDDGYPTHIPQSINGRSVDASTVIALDQQGRRLPSGTYTFIFEGTGEIIVSGDAVGDHRYTQAGTYELEFTPNTGGIWITVRESAASDPIRNMRFVMPGHANTYQQRPFNPAYINFLRPFSVVRFMQTMQTSSGTYPCDNGVAPGNPSCTKGWLLRTEMNDQTQAAVRGPALEYLVDIANESNSDLWINIQHGADATYMRRMAEMVRDRLNRHLRVYIEYSNETFNPDSITYPQRAWVDGNGISLNLDSNTYVAGQKFYGLRSLEMFRIFDEVFGEQRTRVVKVFVGWMVTPETTDAVLSYMAQSENNPSGVRPSAVSIAPYTGFFIAGAIIEAGTVASTTVSQILDMAEANVVREQINIGDNSTEESILAMIQAHQAVANRHNLSMVSYEGGQHIVQMNGNDNNVELGNKLIAANRHPRMYSIYHSLMDAWFNNGGGVFIAYTGALTPSVAWGSFGTVEYLGQDLSEAHKHRALLDYLAQLSSSQLTRNR